MELETDLYREVTGGRAWSNWQHWKFTGLNLTGEGSVKSPEHTEGQKKFIHYVVCLTTGPKPPYDRSKASLRQVQSLLTTGLKPPYDRSKASLRQVQSLPTTGPKPPYDRSKVSLRQVQSLLTTDPKLPYDRSEASLRQVKSLFQSQFSTDCDLRLPISIFNTLLFPSGYSVAAYVFFLIFPLLSFSFYNFPFNNVF